MDAAVEINATPRPGNFIDMEVWTVEFFAVVVDENDERMAMALLI